MERSFRWFAGPRADLAHEPKTVAIDLGPGSGNQIACRFPAGHPLVGLAADRRLRYFRSALELEAGRSLPWVPHRLPFQLLRIGSFAVSLTPFEPTTVAGRRIRAAVLGELGRFGVRDVVSAGYANAYASYLTTPEEYDVQDYEGTMNLFGRDSLDQTCVELRSLARRLVSARPHADVGALPIDAPLPEWLPGPARSVPPPPRWESHRREARRWDLRLERSQITTGA